MQKVPNRLTFITFGVDDLELMKNWYIEKFGWKPVKDEDGIVFFKLNGFIFSLFPKHELADDIGVDNNGQGFKNFSMAINLRSEQEVDQLFYDLTQKEVAIIKKPEKVFWGGYRGYISDPENNYWEIAYNPFLKLDERGDVK